MVDLRTQTGCLGSILRLFGVGRETSPSDDSLRYRLRDDFLSPAERSFYLVLRQAVGDGVTVCPKVNLADLFYAPRATGCVGQMNRINRKHVDFVLCDAASMRPFCAVELDDSSHSKQRQQDRDFFKDQVFESAGLPLLRFPARGAYEVEGIRAAVAKARAATAETPRPVTESRASEPPVCPKCDLPMVLRTARRGGQRGSSFYGCINYPKCRETVAIPAAP